MIQFYFAGFVNNSLKGIEIRLKIGS